MRSFSFVSALCFVLSANAASACDALIGGISFCGEGYHLMDVKGQGEMKTYGHEDGRMLTIFVEDREKYADWDLYDFLNRRFWIVGQSAEGGEEAVEAGEVEESRINGFDSATITLGFRLHNVDMTNWYSVFMTDSHVVSVTTIYPNSTPDDDQRAHQRTAISTIRVGLQ